MSTNAPPAKKVGALPAGPPIIMPITRQEPRRSGCLRFVLLTVIALVAIAGAGWLLVRLSLEPAREECARVASGTDVHDVESTFARELDARRTGYGGPTGGPIAEVDVGVRGGLVSWECELTLAPDGRVTGTHFVPWITPVLPQPIERWLEGTLR